MGDIREWLAAHGLGQVADRLAAQDVDLDVLPDLTDEDLRGQLHPHRSCVFRRQHMADVST